jgi:hypothetical protein
MPDNFNLGPRSADLARVLACARTPEALSDGDEGRMMATQWVPRTEYERKLQDPRWQAKRLEILQRDSFQCQSCGDCRSMLHVHHVMYCTWERLDPWDAPSALLVTLCAACHESEPAIMRDAVYTLMLALGRAGIRTAMEVQRIYEISAASVASEIPDQKVADSIAEVIRGHALERERQVDSQTWYFDR